MAECVVDLVEETNDVDDWVYNDKDNKSDTNSVTNISNDGTEQQGIRADPPEYIINNDDEHHDYQYDNEFAGNDEIQHIPGSVQVDEYDNQLVNDDEDDLSKHTLILRKTINDSGHLVEGYFCQQCSSPFSTIESFLQSHQCTELFNENTTHQDSTQQESQNKLWDLVEHSEATNDNEENNDMMEIKNVINSVEATKEDDNSASAVDLDDERYFCYECQQVFTDLTAAEQHDCSNQVDIATNLGKEAPSLLTDSSDKNVFRCNLCNKDYPSLRSFHNHQRWHKRSADMTGQTKTLQKEAVICEICNTIFESQKNLKLHMKIHKKHTLKSIQDALPVGAQNEYKELNQFFCEICNKSFDQKLLGIHKNMHQNIEEYNCSKCNRQFENLPSFEIHLQMHSSDSGPYVKKMSPSKKLNNSISNTESSSTSSNVDGASSQRKHACQYCGKEFQRPYEKVKHERIHTGEKPYECEVCGKKFRVSYSLTLHLRTHTDIRPYVCATCNKRFKQQSVYVHHMKTHLNERSYKCDICGKSFRTSVQLSGHKNSHSKPFNCTECNRPFASLYAVKIHMKTHNKTHKANKNLKNRCAICGASYARIFALRYHLKEQHDVDIDPSELLDLENVSEKDIDVETAILMDASNGANEQINVVDDEDSGRGNAAVTENQINHEENISQSITNNVYLDETEAATQTILNTEEIIVDNLYAEEIITDWLSK